MRDHAICAAASFDKGETVFTITNNNLTLEQKNGKVDETGIKW